MDSNFPDENVIREYLLGTLPEQDWDEIEQKLLSDEEFAEFVDSIEDDIIEEYLTIQNHFLRPPERQRKLLFASAMRSNLRKEAPVYAPRSLPPARASRLYWGATLGAAAVLLLLTAPLGVYTAMLHSNLTTAQAKVNGVESNLAQVSVLATNLQKELELRDNQESVTMKPTDRSLGQVHTFDAKTKSVEIRIDLNRPISPLYHAGLQATGHGITGGKVEWSKDDIQPVHSHELVFRIPYYGPGIYSFTIKGSQDKPNSRPITLSFKAIEQTP